MRYPLLFVIIFFALAEIFSCEAKTSETANQPFCLSDTLEKRVTIDEATIQPVKNAVSLSGKISANEDKVVKVFPVVGGIVQELKVHLGDYVTKGQVLAVVRSGEIADYQNQLSTAESNQKIAEKALNDEREMFTSGLATQKDMIAAEADL